MRQFSFNIEKHKEAKGSFHPSLTLKKFSMIRKVSVFWRTEVSLYILSGLTLWSHNFTWSHGQFRECRRKFHTSKSLKLWYTQHNVSKDSSDTSYILENKSHSSCKSDLEIVWYWMKNGYKIGSLRNLSQMQTVNVVIQLHFIHTFGQKLI